MHRMEDRESIGHRLGSVRSSFLERAFSLRSSGDASGDYSKFVDEIYLPNNKEDLREEDTPVPAQSSSPSVSAPYDGYREPSTAEDGEPDGCDNSNSLTLSLSKGARPDRSECLRMSGSEG